MIVMKWMGWSWRDLLEAPDDLVRSVIPEMIREEQLEQERGR